MQQIYTRRFERVCCCKIKSENAHRWMDHRRTLHSIDSSESRASRKHQGAAAVSRKAMLYALPPMPFRSTAQRELFAHYSTWSRVLAHACLRHMAKFAIQQMVVSSVSTALGIAAWLLCVRFVCACDSLRCTRDPDGDARCLSPIAMAMIAVALAVLLARSKTTTTTKREREHCQEREAIARLWTRRGAFALEKTRSLVLGASERVWLAVRARCAHESSGCS